MADYNMSLVFPLYQYVWVGLFFILSLYVVVMVFLKGLRDVTK